jgi:hypothetical protein
MPARNPTAYLPQFPRWAHQDKALRAMRDATAFALFMEMRTGKTKCILDEFGEDELNGVISQLLVVAPAGVYRTWAIDADKHLSDDLKSCLRVGRWKSGPNAAEKRELEAFMAYDGPRMLLVNIEALSLPRNKSRTICEAFLLQGPTTMVIDESTTIKNLDAERTDFCVKMAPWAKKRRILSGLPSPQSPLDLYSQFNFLGAKLLGYRRYASFEQRYAVTQQKPFGPGGRMVSVVVGYQNLDELHRKIQPFSFRVRLNECYDLPDKMYLRRDVDPTDEQKRAYAEMKAFCVAELDNMERVTATVVLTQMLRLHQILAGHTMSDDGNIVDIPENKTDEVLSILENTAGKAIIWVAYDADVKKVTARIEKIYGVGSVARFWGGNSDTREDEEKQFKTDPKCRFMVATASAGGRGRTWDVADTIIYYSNTFSLEHRMQSEERTQAVGKTVGVAVFDLITMGSIEEKIVMALRDKMDLSNIITGDNWKQWVI